MRRGANDICRYMDVFSKGYVSLNYYAKVTWLLFSVVYISVSVNVAVVCYFVVFTYYSLCSD
jgi:hypothetical protein